MNVTVDACVVSAASKNENPTSICARAALEELRKGAHEIVMNDILLNEWNSHISNFSSGWLTSMYAKKRVSFVDVPPHITNSLDSHIGRIVDVHLRAIAQKDSHVLGLAFTKGEVVCSSERACKRVFDDHVFVSWPRIGDIAWINPLDGQACVDAIATDDIPDHMYIGA